MKAWMIGLAVLAAVYAGVCLFIYTQQRSLIYYPQTHANPGVAPTVQLSREGERIAAYAVERPGARALLYFGGNGDDVSLGVTDIAAAFPDHSIYLLHYRGYGASTGKPSEQALIGDALALHDLVQKTRPDITLIGRSLGSGIATQVASQRQVKALVLVTPFHSILQIAQQHYPYLPTSLLLHDKYESWRHAPAISAPTHIVAAENDEVIPVDHAHGLHRHFRPGVARITVIPGVGHNTISDRREYWAAITP